MSSPQRQVFNFDLDWQLYIGDLPVKTFENVKSVKAVKGASVVSLPHAFNGKEAFCKRRMGVTNGREYKQVYGQNEGVTGLCEEEKECAGISGN